MTTIRYTKIKLLITSNFILRFSPKTRILPSVCDYVPIMVCTGVKIIVIYMYTEASGQQNSCSFLEQPPQALYFLLMLHFTSLENKLASEKKRNKNTRFKVI